jgi:hypothetical protein
MGESLGEQRKSRKRFAINSTRDQLSAPPAPTDRHPGTTTETAKAGRHQTPPAAQRLHSFPSRQPQSRNASLIACDYRNPKRDKKILDQKGLTEATKPR